MWGVVPVEEDGSAHFYVPANRNIYLQALDGDYMELQRERTYVNYMPGERRSCVGCHEHPDTTPPHRRRPQVLDAKPIPLLPTGDELRYRAKAWLKGKLPPAVEERTRTVRAVNLLAR